MENINKENLESKLIQFTTKRDKLKSQINDGVIILQKLDGAIETIELLLSELNKVDTEANKE